jgi:hypothetical protein
MSNNQEQKTYKDIIPLGEIGPEIPEKYSHYSLTVVIGENIYFKWNSKADKKIKDNFDWDTVFREPEPVEWYCSKVSGGIDGGYVKPKFRFISLKYSTAKNTKQEYLKALKLFDLSENEEVTPDKVSSIGNYKDTLYKQLQRQIDKIKELDNEIKRILKVFYHETENRTIKGINDFPKDKAKRRAESWREFIGKFHRLCHLVFSGADAERVSGHKIFNNDYTDDIIKHSTKSGVKKFVREKQPFLNVAVKLARRIQPLERILEDAILYERISTAKEYEKEMEKQFIQEIRKEIKKIGAKKPVEPKLKLAQKIYHEYAEKDWNDTIKFLNEIAGIEIFKDGDDYHKKRWNFENRNTSRKRA